MHRLLLTLLLTAGVQVCNAAEPELKGMLPSCVRRGESQDVTLIGGGLDAGGSLRFSHEGITAQHIDKDRFRITATPEVAIGSCDVWVATAGGLVGPRCLSVTDSPVILEQEGNDVRDKAQSVAIPAVIDARLDKAADLDWFAFDARPDQRLTISAHSRSLDGSVRPTFTLFDPANREVLHSDSSRHEPYAAITIQSEGTYRLLVHERAYRKDDASYYRIELHDGSPSSTQNVSEERSTPISHVGYAAGFDEEATSKRKEESADSPSAKQTLFLPTRIAGTFATRNDIAWFRFAAKKDQALHIEAFGERLDQLMDLDVAIHASDGKQLATAKDIAAPKGIPAALPLASLDAAIDWKVPADGEYDIAIRDLYGSSIFGPNRRYELVVQNQQPAFYVVALSGNGKPGQGVFVKRGSEAELTLIAVRSGGFGGAVTIRAEDAPAGVAIAPCTVGAKETIKQLKVSASKEAVVGFRTLRLVAEAEIDSDKRTSEVVNAAVVRAGWTRRIDELVMYVSD